MQGAGKIAKQPLSRKPSSMKRLMGFKINSAPQKMITRKYRLKPKSCAKALHSARTKEKLPESSKKLSGDMKEKVPVQHDEIKRRHVQKIKSVKKDLQKTSYKCYARRRPLTKNSDEKSLQFSSEGKGKDGVDDGVQKNKRRRKQKGKKQTVHKDEASRLQRRTKYLLIKMRLEHNLIDAYSGEGWKGQSREKIKPEKELKRAEEQILKCKLGIRDAMRQLDLLSSEGCIGDSVMAQDGSVFHEHIFCAKCKLQHASPDNDIILCDGTCNCAFHQKCLDPPLATEDIPPGDEGWFCKFCECKMEILDTLNAYLGTKFSMSNSWEDVFKEATVSQDGINAALNYGEEWPSDDSEDDDYDPERNEVLDKEQGFEDLQEGDSSSSSGSLSFWSSDEDIYEDGISFLDENLNGDSNEPQRTEEINDGPLDSAININSDNEADIDPKHKRRRKRNDVDYKKLYDEMFGKGPCETEHISEDEDWGPHRRRKRKEENHETGASPAPPNDADENLCTDFTRDSEKKSPSIKDKKKFRIPSNAAEKLRATFTENELPPKEFKEKLSKQLNLPYEKVNKWFKNARYTALKSRKEEPTKESQSTAQMGEMRKTTDVDQAAVLPVASSSPTVSRVQVSESSEIVYRRRSKMTVSSEKERKGPAFLPQNVIETLQSVFLENQKPSVSLKRRLSRRLHVPYYQVSFWFRNMVSGPLRKKKVRVSGSRATWNPTSAPEATSMVCERDAKKQTLFDMMERLFKLEDKISKFKEVLRAAAHNEDDAKEVGISNPDTQIIMYVPVVEVSEKPS